MFQLQDYVKTLPKLDLTQRVHKSEFEERIRRMRRALRRRGLDAGLAYGNEWRPGDTGWLTGYDPHIESTACIVGPTKVLVLGGPEGMHFALQTMQVGEYRNVEEFKIPDEDYPGFEFQELRELLAEACGRRPQKVGVLTLKSNLPQALVELVEKTTRARLIDASDLLLKMRYRKSAAELEMIRIAAAITSWGMDIMLKTIRPGMRELEVAAFADFVMKWLGADRLGVCTQVQSGPRAVTLIGRATNKVIEEGEMVGLGVSARYDGLAACVRRTVVAGGKLSGPQRRLLEEATNAFEMSTEKFRCGAPAREVDLTARRYLRQFGVEMFYSEVHNVGWTECQEGYGAATQYSRYRFPKGIAAQLDLGIYGADAFGVPASHVGFTVEDPFLIDHAGKTHRLTSIPARAYEIVPTT